jgi:transposase InsO family protein
MAKASLEERIRAVLLYLDAGKEPREITTAFGISVRTLWRWISAYRTDGVEKLKLRKPGPDEGTDPIPRELEDRILRLKQKHPSWGARRIKYQYDLPCHWMTVHRVIKRHGMLIRIKAKPQPPPSKRFQRKHVDSMWQGDSFQFRISNVGKVYVTGFTDDRSRFRVRSGAYLHKSAKEAIDALQRALRRGRIPREMYLDNAKQFTAKEFKAELAKYHIKPIFGKPYHPQGRGKIERYHKALWEELITQVRFTSLAHFKRELRRFDRRYNYWRKSQPLGWKTPAEIYNDSTYFNKDARNIAME